LIGVRDAELLPPDMLAEVRKNDRVVIAEDRVVEAEEVVPGPHGPRTYLSIKFGLRDEHGKRVVCGISTDITDRKLMEDELRRAVRAREDLLAVVSHDLRNPLQAVKLTASLLLPQVGQAPHLRKHLEMIERASDRMEHLIQDLLDSASIHAGGLSLHRQREVVASVVTEAVELQAPIAAERTIQLSVELAVDGAEIDCDRQRLLQVFANLIGNALKFCPSGGVIRVAASQRSGEILFSVNDTGPGIPPEQLGSLFEPYRAGLQPGHGAGLGLYISKGLVQAHGGRIWVESELGQGTTFFFTLPSLRRLRSEPA
jgi:signal transduction histidine kinase